MEVAKKIFYGSKKEDFKQEVLALLGFFHANILSLFHFTLSECECSIYMELMEEDLSSLIQKKKRKFGHKVPFSNFVVVDIILQLVESMYYLHSKKIMHRDLKP